MKDLDKRDIEGIILSENWEVRATLRAMVRRSLYLTAKLLVSYNEPRNTMTAEVFKERQDWLQWVVTEKKRGLLEDPRSYIKTSGSTRTIPVWCSIQRTDDRYDHPTEIARADTFITAHPHLKGTDMRLAIAGDTKAAAKRFTGAIRRFYMTNPFFQFLFPELMWTNPLRTDYGSFNDEEMYLPGRLQPELPGAFITAIGTETAIVGGRLDVLIVSDLVGDHNWRSSGEMARLRDWLKTAPALLSHRDPRHPHGGVVLVEENRWTLDDVNSLIHNEYQDWAIWRRGVYRCYVHGVGNCGRWGSDESRDCAPTDQSLWPEGPYKDAAALARLRQEEGDSIFAAQRLNDPTAASELRVDAVKSFKLDICPVVSDGRTTREWCVVVKDDKGEEIIPLAQLEPHIISIDPATSQETTSARTAISWFAYDRPTRRRFCIDIRADRFGPDESVWQAIDLLDELDAKCPGKSRKVIIEKVAAQSYMAVALKMAANKTRTGERRKRVNLPPIDMIPPARGVAKEDRIKRRVGNIIGQGLLYVRAGLALPFHEIRHFPTGTLDWLDTAAQAEEVFLNQGEAGIDAQTAARRAHRLARLSSAGRVGAGI